MTYSVFEVVGPVTLSLSKGCAERPLPAMARQAHHDSPFTMSFFLQRFAKFYNSSPA